MRWPAAIQPTVGELADLDPRAKARRACCKYVRSLQVRGKTCATILVKETFQACNAPERSGDFLARCTAGKAMRKPPTSNLQSNCPSTHSHITTQAVATATRGVGRCRSLRRMTAADAIPDAPGAGPTKQRTPTTSGVRLALRCRPRSGLSGRRREAWEAHQEACPPPPPPSPNPQFRCARTSTRPCRAGVIDACGKPGRSAARKASSLQLAVDVAILIGQGAHNSGAPNDNQQGRSLCACARQFSEGSAWHMAGAQPRPDSM